MVTTRVENEEMDGSLEMVSAKIEQGVQNPPKGMKRLPGNKFMSLAKGFTLIDDDAELLNQIPHGDKSNSYCFLNAGQLTKDHRGFLYYDDCGTMGASGKSHKYVLLKPDLKHIKEEKGKYFKNSRGPKIEISVSPSSVVKATEYKSDVLKQNKFERKVTKYVYIDKGIEKTTILVQYQGNNNIFVVRQQF